MLNTPPGYRLQALLFANKDIILDIKPFPPPPPLAPDVSPSNVQDSVLLLGFFTNIKLFKRTLQF